MSAGEATVAQDIAAEYEALADLLERNGPAVWDAPSLCEGWRTREVVAHMTMPARYDSPAFLAELEASGGDFTRFSDMVASRDGASPVADLLADLRSPALHAWQPPGGGELGALVHCVIHALDIVEAVPLDRRVPATRIRPVLELVAAEGTRDEPLRGRSQRRGTAGRRPGMVIGVGRVGDGVGAGIGAARLRAPLAAGPPARRGRRSLQPAVNG